MKKTFLTLATAVMILGTAAACGQQPQKTNNAEATEQVAEPAAAPAAETPAEEAIATPDDGVTSDAKGDEAVASAPAGAPEAAVQSATVVE